MKSLSQTPSTVITMLQVAMRECACTQSRVSVQEETRASLLPGLRVMPALGLVIELIHHISTRSLVQK